MGELSPPIPVPMMTAAHHVPWPRRCNLAHAVVAPVPCLTHTDCADQGDIVSGGGPPPPAPPPPSDDDDNNDGPVWLNEQFRERADGPKKNASALGAQDLNQEHSEHVSMHIPLRH